MQRIVVSLALLSCVGVAAHASAASSLESLFAAGNSAYFQGDYASAAARYQELVDAGIHDADLYFNLGTAQARLGALGRAILCFERAQLLAPQDTEIATALGMARSALGKRRAQAQGEATIETRPPLLQALVVPYREDTLAGWVLALNLLFFGLLLLRPRLRGDSLRAGIAMLAATTLLGLGSAAGALAVKRGIFDEGQAAVVLRENAELREGPDPRARSRGHAHEGQNARVLRRDGSFLRVRVAGGAEGWLQGSDVGVMAQD